MTLLDEILKDPSKVSVAVLCLAAVTAFVKGWIVPKWAYDDLRAGCTRMEAQRDKLQDMLIQQSHTTDRALEVAQKKVSM
jgi:hypothetical protein